MILCILFDKLLQFFLYGCELEFGVAIKEY